MSLSCLKLETLSSKCSNLFLSCNLKVGGVCFVLLFMNMFKLVTSDIFCFWLEIHYGIFLLFKYEMDIN